LLKKGEWGDHPAPEAAAEQLGGRKEVNYPNKGGERPQKKERTERRFRRSVSTGRMRLGNDWWGGGVQGEVGEK